MWNQFGQTDDLSMEHQQIEALKVEKSIVLSIKELVIALKKLRKVWNKITTIGDISGVRIASIPFWEIIHKSASYDSKMSIWSPRLRKLLVLYAVGVYIDLDSCIYLI